MFVYQFLLKLRLIIIKYTIGKSYVFNYLLCCNYIKLRKVYKKMNRWHIIFGLCFVFLRSDSNS